MILNFDLNIPCVELNLNDVLEVLLVVGSESNKMPLEDKYHMKIRLL